MTDEELNAIEERAKKATPGPWRTLHDYAGPDSEKFVYDTEDFPIPRGEMPSWYEEGDAEFIAHARTDVPALVAEVRRLRSLLASSQPPASPSPAPT